MRKSTVEKMEEHINKINEIPKDIKKQNRKKILANIIFAIIFIVYIYALILGKKFLAEEIFINSYKIASMVSILMAIVLFEISYKKDNGFIALYGIETFVISLFTLFSKNLLKNEIPMWLMLSGIYVAVYYLIKCLIINNREKNIYLRQNSDLQEITKKESQDKLKPIMEQKNKENIKKEKTKKQANTNKKTNSETKNKKTTTKTGTKTTKKKANTKKTTTNKNTNKKEKK